MKNCPCGSTLSFDECCKPYISGKKNAPTAEATMRARYSAYVTHDIDYIEKTNKPNHGEAFDREAAKLWAEKSEWLGLEVVVASESEVEFIAKFKTDGKELRHHEVSQFEKIDGQWFYMDGKILKSPDVRSAPKIGRNDPCTCGSGKKYKKCCAA